METVVLQSLSKTYSGGKLAVRQVSLSLNQGEVFGFLGPNGAGKTTTVKLLNGMLSPTEGSCQVLGVNPAKEPEKVHRVSGVLTEHAQMYDNTAEKRTQFVNDLVEVIWDFDKHSVTTLTGYIDNRAYIIKVTDILRIFSLNQKVYIQTANGEFLIKNRLYEIEDVLRKQKFLRISNSEIVNIKKITDIDLSIIGRVCIRLSGDICVYVSMFSVK